MAEKSRETLKEFFEAGKIPTQENFADLVDSNLNSEDDDLHVSGDNFFGIGTADPKAPLSIRSAGENEDLISLEDKDLNERWRISRKTSTNMEGLLIQEYRDKNPVAQSQLMIKADGDVGIGTVQPEEKLHINGAIVSNISEADNTNNFPVGDGYLYLGTEKLTDETVEKAATIKYSSDNKKLTLTADNKVLDQVTITHEGKIGINQPDPNVELHVNGNLMLQQGNSINHITSTMEVNKDESLEIYNSNIKENIIPTEQAIRKFIDDMFTGTVVAFAVSNPPDGWLNCDGALYNPDEYPGLFNRIGYKFGQSGLKFKVPPINTDINPNDANNIIQELFIRGTNNGGNVGQIEDHQLQYHKHQEEGRHDHPYWDIFWSEITGDYRENLRGHHGDEDSDNRGHQLRRHTEGNERGVMVGNPTSGKSGHETRPKNMRLLYCIKY